MEKNENGMPRSVTERGGDCGCERDERGGMNGAQSTHYHNHTCGGDGSCLDDMPLAYVYAPNQKFRMLYSASDALKHGTRFEELYKPMGVYGNE